MNRAILTSRVREMTIEGNMRRGRSKKLGKRQWRLIWKKRSLTLEGVHDRVKWWSCCLQLISPGDYRCRPDLACIGELMYDDQRWELLQFSPQSTTSTTAEVVVRFSNYFYPLRNLRCVSKELSVSCTLLGYVLQKLSHFALCCVCVL